MRNFFSDKTENLWSPHFESLDVKIYVEERLSEMTACAERKTMPDDRKCRSDIKNAVKAGDMRGEKKLINKQTSSSKQIVGSKLLLNV